MTTNNYENTIDNAEYHRRMDRACEIVAAVSPQAQDAMAARKLIVHAANGHSDMRLDSLGLTIEDIGGSLLRFTNVLHAEIAIWDALDDKFGEFLNARTT